MNVTLTMFFTYLCVIFANKRRIAVLENLEKCSDSVIEELWILRQSDNDLQHSPQHKNHKLIIINACINCTSICRFNVSTMVPNFPELLPYLFRIFFQSQKPQRLARMATMISISKFFQIKDQTVRQC